MLLYQPSDSTPRRNCSLSVPPRRRRPLKPPSESELPQPSQLELTEPYPRPPPNQKPWCTRGASFDWSWARAVVALVQRAASTRAEASNLVDNIESSNG